MQPPCCRGDLARSVEGGMDLEPPGAAKEIRQFPVRCRVGGPRSADSILLQGFGAVTVLQRQIHLPILSAAEPKRGWCRYRLGWGDEFLEAWLVRGAVVGDNRATKKMQADTEGNVGGGRRRGDKDKYLPVQRHVEDFNARAPSHGHPPRCDGSL